MKEIYLPKLNRIEIFNYSLYFQNPSFEFDFKDGINAVIGVNGIGKTTFIEIILYCLVGFKREFKEGKGKNKNKLEFMKKRTDFFRARFDDKFSVDKNESASAELTYEIQGEVISISRSLSADEINYIKINGKQMNITEEEYDEFILKKLKFSDFRSLQKIIRTFLVFDEQRLNVAWETDSQDEILRILLLEGNMLEEFNKLEKEIVSLDTEGRHLSEDRRVAKERLAAFNEEKEKLLSSAQEIGGKNVGASDHNYEHLINQKNATELEVEGIKEDIDSILDKQEEITYEKNKLIGERNALDQEIEKVDTNINSTESELYSSIYESLPDYYFSIEKSLVNDGKCLVCNSKSADLKQEFRLTKERHQCIICESELKEELDIKPELITALNELYDHKEKLVTRIKNKQNDIDKIDNEYALLNNNLRKLTKEKEKRSSHLIQLDSIIAEQKKDLPTDTYSQLIWNLDKQILDLNDKVDEVYRKRDKSRKKLENLQDRFAEQLANLNQQLSTYFNKYASTFIGLECELTVKRQRIRHIPHIKFLPKINGDEREDIYSVSESQRFFLDQAFRMAIIDFLQSNIPYFHTFFITETPEGSLDIAYEEQVADMFLIFAQSNNNIIFTSNLNSSNFLYKIFNEVREEERQQRILNMLTKGKLTQVHKDHNKQIREIVIKLFGDDIENERFK